jgi:hypothetical protein
MKTGTRIDVFGEAHAELLARLQRAVTARRAADAAVSSERPRLSARGWRAGLLPLSGGTMEDVDRLRAQMTSHPHLFPNTIAYVHDVGMMIRNSQWWGPGTEAPWTAGADRRQAEVELGRIGYNAFTAALVAVEDLSETRPAVFGPADDVRVHAAEQAAIVEQAASELASLRAVPVRVLVGHAHEHGVDLDPLGSLAQRLVEHELAGRPPRAAAKARVAEGVTVLAAQ